MVAILCNHQKTVSKGFENASIVMNEALKSLIKYLEELKDHIKSFKGKKKPSEVKKSTKKNDEEDEDSKLKKVFPDSLDKTFKLITKIEEKVAKKERDIQSREDNKQVALNTSKLNYMDPRITVSWCKKHEVPIEKVFPRNVLDKFPWAMYTDIDYSF
jgi:DNA topoisomerase I